MAKTKAPTNELTAQRWARGVGNQNCWNIHAGDGPPIGQVWYSQRGRQWVGSKPVAEMPSKGRQPGRMAYTEDYPLPTALEALTWLTGRAVTQAEVDALNLDVI